MNRSQIELNEKLIMELQLLYRQITEMIEADQILDADIRKMKLNADYKTFYEVFGMYLKKWEREEI